MYFTNTLSSLTNYFPTILCNSHEFKRTVVNHNLQYVTFDKPYKLVPQELNSSDFDAMVRSGAAFASQFKPDDSVLDRIDKEILGRNPGEVVPGGWCLGESMNGSCSVWGDADVLRPSPASARLEKRIVELLSDGALQARQCTVE